MSKECLNDLEKPLPQPKPIYFNEKKQFFFINNSVVSSNNLMSNNSTEFKKIDEKAILNNSLYFQQQQSSSSTKSAFVNPKSIANLNKNTNNFITNLNYEYNNTLNPITLNDNLNIGSHTVNAITQNNNFNIESNTLNLITQNNNLNIESNTLNPITLSKNLNIESNTLNPITLNNNLNIESNTLNPITLNNNLNIGSNTLNPITLNDNLNIGSNTLIPITLNNNLNIESNTLNLLALKNNLNIGNNSILLNKNFTDLLLNNPLNFDIENQFKNLFMFLNSSKNTLVPLSIEMNSIIQQLEQSNQIKQTTVPTKETQQLLKNNMSVAVSKNNSTLTTNSVAGTSATIFEREIDSGNETQNSISPTDSTSINSSPSFLSKSDSFSFSVNNLLKGEVPIHTTNTDLKKSATLNNLLQSEFITLIENEQIKKKMQKPVGTNSLVSNISKIEPEFQKTNNQNLTLQPNIHNNKTSLTLTPDSTSQVVNIDSTNKTVQQENTIKQESSSILSDNSQLIDTTSIIKPISSQLTVKEVIKQAGQLLKKNKPFTDTTNNNNSKINNNNIINASQQIQEAQKSLSFQSNNYLESLQKQHILSISNQQLGLNNQTQSQQQVLMFPPNFTQYPSSSAQLCINLNSLPAVPVGVSTIGATSINPAMNSIISLTPHTYSMAAALHQQQQQNIQNQQLFQHIFASRTQNDYCVICGDRASGFHYSVMSCEGCKGFFRRSIQKDIRYQCHKNKMCIIDRVTRNRCQSCRFDKCVQKGMNPATVRSDKNRKRKNDELIEKNNELNETRETMLLIKSVLQSFDLAFSKEETFTCWANVQESCEKFTTGIPTYLELISDNDRKVLIKQSLPGIAILRALFNTKSIESKELDVLIASSDFSIITASTPTEISKIFSNFRNGFPIESVLHEEFAILSAIALTQPTALDAKLESPATVSDISGRLSVCLHTQLSLRKDDLSITKVFTVIIRKMAELFR